MYGKEEKEAKYRVEEEDILICSRRQPCMEENRKTAHYGVEEEDSSV